MKSPLQPFTPAAARSRSKPHPANVAKYNVGLNTSTQSFQACRLNTDKNLPIQVLRNNFSIGTWIALGSVLQGVASLLLPRRYALVPAVSLLAFRLLRAGLMCLGLVPNPHMDKVFLGKFTSLIPGRDGSPPKRGSDQEVAVMILATRSNQCVAPRTPKQFHRTKISSPLGIFAPGYNQLSTLFGKLLMELHKKAEETGCKQAGLPWSVRRQRGSC
jgi:hypothetical protein